MGAGALPILLAPETAELHYALQKRVDDGEVKWIKEVFRDEHVFTLGREDVGHVVDAVFVTSGPREPLSMTDPVAIAKFTKFLFGWLLIVSCRRAYIDAV